jgi:hypothetical protein
MEMISSHDIQVVTVIRNPYDVFVSLYHFVQNFPDSFPKGHPLHAILDKPIDHPDVLHFITAVERGFGIHLHLAYAWLTSGRSHITRYEDLKNDTFEEVRRLVSGLAPAGDGLIRQAVAAASAENLRKRDPSLSRHIRKASTGDWKNHLSERHLELFRAHHGDLIQKLGYEVIE